MVGSLAGKVALVTGASRGLGAHFVEVLVSSGLRVAALARSSAELDDLQARYPGRVVAFGCDVGDVMAVDAVMADVVGRLGRLDILVNNAAIYRPFRLEDAPPREVEDHVRVNLLAPIWCMRAAIPHLRRTRGHIVSISSESVRLPFPHLGVYAATKGGLEVLSAAMREELREDGVRVSVLRSGSITGSTGAQGWDPAVAQAFFKTIEQTGHAAFTGASASPTSMAAALIAMLALPQDINVDVIEVRAAAPGRAGGADTLAAEGERVATH